MSPTTLSIGYWDEDDGRLRIAVQFPPTLSTTSTKIAVGKCAQQLSGARGAILCDTLLSILDERDAQLSTEWRFDAVTLMSGMLSLLKATAESHGLPKSAALIIILPDGTGPSLRRSIQDAASTAGFRPTAVRSIAGCLVAKSETNARLIISFDNLALTATLFGSDPANPIEVLHCSELGGDSIVTVAQRLLTTKLSTVGFSNPSHYNRSRLRQAAATLVAALDKEGGIASTIIDYQGRSVELHLSAAELAAEQRPHVTEFENELNSLKRRHDLPTVAHTVYSEVRLPPWLIRLVMQPSTGVAPNFVKAQHVMEGSIALGAESTLAEEATGGNMIGIIISGTGRPRFDLLFDLAKAGHRKVVRHFSFGGLAQLEFVRSSADGESYISLGTATFPEYTMLGWPIQFEFALDDGGAISIVGSDLKSGVTARRALRTDCDPLGSDGALADLARSVRRVRFVQTSL